MDYSIFGLNADVSRELAPFSRIKNVTKELLYVLLYFLALKKGKSSLETSALRPKIEQSIYPRSFLYEFTINSKWWILLFKNI